MDDEGCDEEDENEEHVAFKNEIKEKFATLNIKTYRMVQKMTAAEAGSPYDMLDAMRASIDELEEARRGRMKVCGVLLRACSLAKDEYYKAKVIKRAAGKELAILQQLSTTSRSSSMRWPNSRSVRRR
eukprot:556261-Prymnesium_polylepis.1